MTIRRMKTYTGGQGYVYQYYFVGKRASVVHPSETAATEYVFDATSDRKTTFAVSVFLTEDAIRGWSAAHGRTLTDAELLYVRGLAPDASAVVAAPRRAARRRSHRQTRESSADRRLQGARRPCLRRGADQA